jgi:ATP-dependent DNA ligase
MALPLSPPVGPMLAKSASALPEGPGWRYEPKWDGFRCLVFRDGASLTLQSRNERPFDRYFPELAAPLLATLPDRCVVDGEIVIPVGDRGLDFDALLQRIHPAASRVRRLAEETPSCFVAFDLLALGDDLLLDRPLSERRRLLDEALHGVNGPTVFRTPWTDDLGTAQDWFTRFEGAGLDGVVAKAAEGRYTPGERTLVKVKHERTADCVVAGYRIHKDGKGVGSLLLGLYDDAEALHHVGVAASFTAKERARLLGDLQPLTEDAIAAHPWREWAEASREAATAGQRMPGAPSRWNAKKDLSWEAVRIERVVEVTFTQLEGGRFRHNAHVARWRPDRDPISCRYDQLEVAGKVSLADFLGAAPGSTG